VKNKHKHLLHKDLDDAEKRHPDMPQKGLFQMKLQKLLLQTMIQKRLRHKPLKSPFPMSKWREELKVQQAQKQLEEMGFGLRPQVARELLYKHDVNLHGN